MKLGIISDTHDHVKNVKQALKFFDNQNVDLIIHCGDWVSPFMFKFIFFHCKPNAPFQAVLGNNEGDIFMLTERMHKFGFPLELRHHVFEGEVDGKRFIIYHGQDEAVTSSLIDSQNYEVVFTGHTHIPKIVSTGKTLHINPGTTCDAANSKIIDTPTLSLYDTKTNQAKIIEFLKEGL